MNAGDAPAAAELFTRAIQSKELTPEGLALTYHHRGMAFYREGQTGRAILDYSTALWNDDLPKEFRPRTLNNRGLAFEAINDFESAMRDYSLAIKLNPNYAEAFGNRGNLHKRFNRNEEAIADYDSALRNGHPHPQFVFAWQGMALEAQNKKREAMDAFRRALAIDPNFELAKTRLAKLEEGQSLGNVLGRKKQDKGNDAPATMAAAPNTPARNTPWAPATPKLPSIKVAQPAVQPEGGPSDSGPSDSGVPLRPAFDDQPKTLPAAAVVVPASKPVTTTPMASLPGAQPLAAKKPSVVAMAPQTVTITTPSSAPVVSAAPTSQQPGPKILNASNATGEGGSDVEYAIQLGSFKSEELAEGGWKHALKVSGDLLNGLSRVIEGAVMPDKSTVFRLYAEALPDREAALKLCRTLRDKGAPCIVVRR